MPASLLIRLITIPLGIASALALARDGLGFPLLPFLDALITIYDDNFKEVVLIVFEPILALFREWFDWSLNLYPHWKYCFVLQWLYLASWNKAFFPVQKTFVVALASAWAAISAIVAGLLAGSVPLDHPGVFWWPMAGIGMFFAGGSAIDAAFDREDGETPLSRFGFMGLSMIVATAVASLLALKLIPNEAPAVFNNTGSPGLALLATLIGGLGLAMSVLIAVMAAIGFHLIGRDSDNFWERFIGIPVAPAGLEIAFVLGNAASLVYVSSFFT